MKDEESHDEGIHGVEIHGVTLAGKEYQSCQERRIEFSD